MRLTLFVLLASSAMPAVAQDHSGHTMPATPPPAQDACEAEAARHRAMGHPVQEGSCAQGEATAANSTIFRRQRFSRVKRPTARS